MPEPEPIVSATPEPEPHATSPVAPSFQRVLEGSFLAGTSTGLDGPVLSPSVALALERNAWATIASFAYTLPSTRAVTGGTASLQAWRWGIALRRALIEGLEQRWRLFAEAGGALTITQGMVTGETGRVAAAALVPTVSMGLLGEYSLHPRVSLMAGPRLDVFLADSRPFVADAWPFSASWGRAGLDARVRLIF
jgi:hypothetical protein